MGTFNYSTHDDKKFVHDFTRNTWVYLMKFKSDSVMIIRDFTFLVENQYGSTLKIIRTNNGGEFVNRHSVDLFSIKGILHQRTCPYTPIRMVW